MSLLVHPRRFALVFSSASFLVWGTWYVLHPNRHPFGDLSQGFNTDHFSHLSAARLFPRVGANIWRKPVRDLVLPLTPEDIQQLPSDLRPLAGPEGPFKVPGWPLSKPYNSSWLLIPRQYPPGDMVLVAPLALLYHLGPVSFSQINRLLILYFLLLAHVSIYLTVNSFLKYQASSIVGLLGLVLCYFELIHWPLEGFYDVAYVGPLIASFGLLLAGRRPAALAAFAGASFIHFRAFFYAPIAIYAACGILLRREWRDWGRREVALIATAIVLGGASLYTFALLWPSLRLQQITNPIGFVPYWPNPTFISFAVLSGLIAAALGWARAWTDLAILLWMSLMWICLPYAYAWYVLALVPWVMAGPLWSRPERASLVRDARLLFMVFTSAFACSYAPLPTWLTRVF